MSAFDYTKTAATVDRLLKRFGASATLQRVVHGTYDPDTGTTTADTTSTWTGVGAKFDYEQKEIDGTNIRTGDQRVYLSVVGIVNPQSGDTLAIGATTYNVVASRPLQPALMAVLYDVQVRGVL